MSNDAAPKPKAVEDTKTKKDDVVSLTVILRDIEGKELKWDEPVEGEETKRHDLSVRKAVLIALTQGPDNLTASGKPPLGDSEKLEAHSLAVAIASRERTGFGFTLEDKTLIKKLASVRLPHAWFCALVEHLDPNAVKLRD